MSNALKAVVSFVLVYFALFLLSVMGSSTGLSSWLPGKFDFYLLDYTLWLLPVPGFFFVYFLIPWCRKEFGFGNSFFTYFFPVLFMLGCYAAFYAAVFYYTMNQFFFMGISFDKFLSEGNTGINYFGLFMNSSFIYFALAGIGGWAARLLVEGTESKKA